MVASNHRGTTEKASRRTSVGLLAGIGKRSSSLIKTSIEDFSNLEQLGEGEFAIVYSAKWSKCPETVAIKVLRKRHSDNDSALKDFYAEEQVLSKLQGVEGIVQLRGYGDTKDGRPFMVLEKLSPATLTKRIPEIVSWSRRVRVGLCIARTLQTLQSGHRTDGYRILHRDLKPDNIGFEPGPDGNVKLLDFGLVCALSPVDCSSNPDAPPPVPSTPKDAPPKSFSAGSQLQPQSKRRYPCAQTRGGSYLYDLTSATGSLRYMAPEVAQGSNYNEKAEVYSWSLIMWQLIEQRRPFEGKDPAFMRDRVFERGWRDSQSEGLYPFGLDDLILRCWSGDCDQRPSFDEIVKSMERILDEDTLDGSPQRRRVGSGCLSCLSILL